MFMLMKIVYGMDFKCVLNGRKKGINHIYLILKILRFRINVIFLQTHVTQCKFCGENIYLLRTTIAGAKVIEFIKGKKSLIM